MKHILMRLEQLIPTLSGNQLDESFINLIREYDNTWQELPEKQQLVALQDLEDVCQSANDNVRLFCYSLISFRGHDSRWMEKMLKTIERLSELPLDALYFLYWQISIRFTRWPECESETGKILHWKLFQRICANCSAQVNGLEWIDEKERHADTVVVLTAQFLGETVHGPSKTALDRCKTLIQKMGKKVLLINTAEISATTNRLSIAGVIPLNYLEYYSSQEYIDWKGTRIPFFQCENDMPNIDTYRMLLQSIVQMKPAYVIEIGTGSLLAHLLSKCLPVLSVVTGFSRLSITETQYQVSALKLKDVDRRVLQAVGKDEQHVIPTVFTFGFGNQQRTVTRAQLGLPENKFLLAVIGMRLDAEIDDAFINMINSLHKNQIGLVCIGSLPTYEEIVRRYPEAREYLYPLGRQDDVLAILEVCDLFVNPMRLGGGTAAAEALSKGVPVVTTSYGDVGATAGEDFWVEDYNEMAELILKYRIDAAFYQQQAEKARARAEKLLDTDGQFAEVLAEFGKRMGETWYLQ